MALSTITFGFPSGYDGFTANPAGATVLSHNTVDGNPDAGCLQASLTGRNVNAGTSNWSKDIRFDNDVGVPAGATLNNVRVTINWRCSNWYVGATGANSTGVSLVGVGSANSGYFESTTAWASLSTGWVVPTGGIADSRTLQALATLRTANNVSANVTTQLDTIVVEVDYDAAIIDALFSAQTQKTTTGLNFFVAQTNRIITRLQQTTNRQTSRTIKALSARLLQSSRSIRALVLFTAQASRNISGPLSALFAAATTRNINELLVSNFTTSRHLVRFIESIYQTKREVTKLIFQTWQLSRFLVKSQNLTLSTTRFLKKLQSPVFQTRRYLNKFLAAFYLSATQRFLQRALITKSQTQRKLIKPTIQIRQTKRNITSLQEIFFQTNRAIILLLSLVFKAATWRSLNSMVTLTFQTHRKNTFLQFIKSQTNTSIKKLISVLASSIRGLLSLSGITLQTLRKIIDYPPGAYTLKLTKKLKTKTSIFTTLASSIITRKVRSKNLKK